MLPMQRILALSAQKIRSSRGHILKALLLILLVFLEFQYAAAQTEQEPAASAGPEIYLAKDNGAGAAGDAVSSFRTTDIPIYCIVLLDSFEPVTVKMNLVAVNVPGVKTETRVVSTSYTTKDGQNRVNFTGKPHGIWVAGKYRADVFIDGKPAGKVDFVIIKGGAVTAKPVTPQPKPSPNARFTRIRKNALKSPFL